MACLDADERPLPGPGSAAYRVEALRPNGSRAVVRRYCATGALQVCTPCLDVARGVVHGTRTTWYEDGRLCTREECLRGRRQGELPAYYPDGALKRCDRCAADQNVLGPATAPTAAPPGYFPDEPPPLYPGGALVHHDVTRHVRPTATEMHRFDTSGPPMRESAYGAPLGEAPGAALPVAPGTARWPVGQPDVVFTITEQGEVADAYVARSSCPGRNEKALAAVRGLTKRFRPGQLDGQTVRATCRVPVVFCAAPAQGPGQRRRL